MTAYKNFIKDFPERCRDILERYESDALSGGREVTLTLAMAASGFVVPYERLRHKRLRPQEGEPPYPDAASGFVVPYERLRHKRLRPQEGEPPYPDGIYEQAASQFDDLLKEKFLGSPLWKEEGSSWSFGKLKSAAGGPDSWPELQDPRKKPLGPCKKVSSILKHLRNALAHGNIFTFPKDDPDKDEPDIKLIIFLSQPYMKSPEFNFLCVSPQDFQKFLKNWFVFTSALNLPEEVFSSTVEDAD